MTKPVLWHIPVSHYNEKARWALAHKGIEHERRAPMPSAHMAVSIWLTRGASYTFPVLELEGRSIGDSTAIIAALEDYQPEPALYPADPGQRRAALELEDYFDEQLGPHIRLLAWHEILADPDGPGLAPVTDGVLPDSIASLGPVKAGMEGFGRFFLKRRYRVDDPVKVKRAREQVVAAMDRLEAELGDGEYLVGDRFTVADLTAASLFYPLVRPPEGPQVIEGGLPAGLERFAAPLRDRRGYAYVEEMFARHRNPASPAVAGGVVAGADPTR